jgi:hypothetical protein
MDMTLQIGTFELGAWANHGGKKTLIFFSNKMLISSSGSIKHLVTLLLSQSDTVFTLRVFG